MPASAALNAPTVLIADQDPWSAELLGQLVLSVRPDAHLSVVSDGQAALKYCQKHLPNLLIADDQLSLLNGTELLRQLRRMPKGPELAYVLISGNINSASVRAVRPLAPAAYLAKPFNAEHLLQRLSSLLPQANDLNPAMPLLPSSLANYLDQVRDSAPGAPLLVDVHSAVSNCLRSEDKQLGELAAEFHRAPQITARLIAAANSVIEQRSTTCQTLQQALQRLGVPRALNLVLGLSLQRSATLDDPRLSERAQQAGSRALHSAELALWLAGQLRLDQELCYTAGLLHNIGDLALLRSLQDWQLAGGVLSDDEIDEHLRHRAASFGSALRTRWRLPLDLRELITAYYSLGGGVFSREALVLNFTAQLLQQSAETNLEALLNGRAASMLRLDISLLRRIPQHLLNR